MKPNKWNMIAFFVCSFTLFCSLAVCKNYDVDLDQSLEDHGFTQIEGHICSGITKQPDFFKKLLKSTPSIRTIGEIGFNAGHSSVIFLESRHDTIVYSFDILNHKYVRCGKEFIDKIFPGRHHLIEGDSGQSIPLFHANNPSIKFDLIFIDGGHMREIVVKDIQNMQKLAHKDTIVILDDANENLQVDQAHYQCKKMNLIKNVKRWTSDDLETKWQKVWLECKYIFND